MKIYTLFRLQQLPGYQVLKDILNEGELQIYYNTPEDQRAELLQDRKVTRRPARVIPVNQEVEKS
jgi:hypothetical protein